MVKHFFTDLKIVLILTFLSVMFLFIPSLNQYPQNMVSYALLLLFLPGYSLLVSIKPLVNKIAVWKRILFSVVLGAILMGTAYLLWIYTPIITYLTQLVKYLNPLEVYVSPLEIYIPLALILSTVLIVDLVLISWARRRAVSDLTPEIQDTTFKTQDSTPEAQKKERYVWCKECQGYYKLEEDESPDDFESCQCGGKLIYAEKPQGEPFTLEQEIKPVQKGSYYLDLLLVLLVNIACLVGIQLANPAYQTIIEFILILFLPGYALISMVYPRKYGLSSIERVVYSIASSIAITTMVGLILNYGGYGVVIDPILYALSGLTVIFLILTFLRRALTREEHRFSIDFSGSLFSLAKWFLGGSNTEKLLSLVLVISLVLMVSITYITANPLEETYTDFYVLGADGNPVNPINLTSGESDNLTISIINQENKRTDYRLLVTSGGNVLMDETVTLKNEERKDIPLSFTVGTPGTRDMEFNLYKLPDNDNVYKSLKIPLNVAEIPVVEENTVIL